MSRILPFLLVLFALVPDARAQHGVISDLSASGSAELCEHEVPADVCTRCHPELEPQFQALGDWCRPHRIPESQCLRCHPNLTFAPMPALGEGADFVDVTEEQALGGLDALAVPGKVTVFAFDAPWCASCRNLEILLRERVASDPLLAVRRIDVAGWEGPVFDRYVADVPGLPYVIIYGPDGQQAQAISLAETAEVVAAIEALQAAQ
jgi:thiol-disulfide isomerase/thioredoxin